MLLLLLACEGPSTEDPGDSVVVDDTGGGADDSGGGDTAPDPLPWEYSSEDPPPPSLDADALAPALEVALARAPQTDPLLFLASYFPLLDGSSTGCPSYQETRPGQIYWIGDCTSERGYVYDGWAVSNEAHGVPGEDGSTCEAIVFYYGFMRIADPGGALLSGWGTVGLQDCVYSGADHRIDAYLTGDFWSSDPVGNWLDQHVPVELTWSSREQGAARELTIGGGYSQLDGEVYAVWLDDLWFGSPEEGACAVEPTGVARLWDTAGAEYEVAFDGDSACDGCGEATAGGASLGPVCVDFTDWYGWTERPWW